MAPKENLKNGGIDLTFYEHEATILSFENVRGRLVQELGNPDLSITSRDMSIFTGCLQQFQEDALGLNAQRPSSAPFRLPAKLFKAESNGKLTTSHPLYHILVAAYSFMLDQGWNNDYNFIATAKRAKVIEMISHITATLVRKNIIRKPRIAFASSVDDQNRKALAKLARSTNGKFSVFPNNLISFRWTTHILLYHSFYHSGRIKRYSRVTWSYGRYR
jgi:hypothetical protein